MSSGRLQANLGKHSTKIVWLQQRKEVGSRFFHSSLQQWDYFCLVNYYVNNNMLRLSLQSTLPRTFSTIPRHKGSRRKCPDLSCFFISQLNDYDDNSITFLIKDTSLVITNIDEGLTFALMTDDQPRQLSPVTTLIAAQLHATAWLSLWRCKCYSDVKQERASPATLAELSRITKENWMISEWVTVTLTVSHTPELPGTTSNCCLCMLNQDVEYWGEYGTTGTTRVMNKRVNDRRLCMHSAKPTVLWRTFQIMFS